MNVRFTIVPALALALGLGAAAFADTRQLAASAGVDPEGYGTAELVALKVNAEARRDDRHPVVIPAVASDPAARAQLAAAAGVSPEEAEAMSLAALAMAKIDSEARGQDRVGAVAPSSEIDGGAGRAQIIASIGLDPEVGRMMTLHEIYLAKFALESDDN